MHKNKRMHQEREEVRKNYVPNRPKVSSPGRDHCKIKPSGGKAQQSQLGANAHGKLHQASLKLLGTCSR